MKYGRPTLLLLACLWLQPESGWSQESLKPGIAAQIRRLSDSNPSIRATARDAIRDTLRSIELSDYDSIVYLSIAGTDGSPALTKFLDDPDSDVQLKATFILTFNGSGQETVIRGLIKQMKKYCRHLPSLATLEDAVSCRLVQLGFVLTAQVSPHANVAPALVRVFEDETLSAVTRGNAAETLGQIGEPAQASIPALLNKLENKHESVSVRSSAAAALGQMGPAAKVAIPALVLASRDENPQLRLGALEGIAGIGAEPILTVPLFVTALKDEDASVRRAAANALGHLDIGHSPALLALTAALKDHDENVRKAAGDSLALISQKEPQVATNLVAMLGSHEKTSQETVAFDAARQNVAYSLGFVTVKPDIVIPALIRALNDSNHDIRQAAATSLGNRGADARNAISALVVTLNDFDFSARNAAADALVSIAQALQQEGTHTEMIGKLRHAEVALQTSRRDKWEAQARDVGRSAAFLEEARKNERWQRLIRLGQEHPTISAVTVLYTVLALVSFLLLWLWPLAILHTNEALKPYMDIPIPIGIGDAKIPVRHLFLLGFFHYHPRVLDAWVSKHIAFARTEFRRMSTVSNRDVHVPTPVFVDGKVILGLAANDLRTIFEAKRACVLIWGEGGAGKTSLACQIALWAMNPDRPKRLSRHLMIPVLIENDLDLKVESGQQAFLEAIRGQLKILTNEQAAASRNFVRALLRRQRLLVIVDGFSELNVSTRDQVRSSDPRFPANALVVTSRVQEHLEGLPRTVINPLRIKGNRLSSFIDSYLNHRSSRGLFEDPEFFLACGRLSSLVGQHDCTVLLAKLYAEQMISLKERHVALGVLPETIPDLMLEYINEVNSRVAGDKRDDTEVQNIAKAICWECLRASYRPAPARLADVKCALGNGEEALVQVQYFESRLHLVEVIGASHDSLKFTLDPVAEYFAALYLVDRNRNDKQAWEDFLEKVDNISGSPETISGFLRAVQDSWSAKHAHEPLSGFVATELARRAVPVDSATTHKL